jgi:hypothetical protein
LVALLLLAIDDRPLHLKAATKLLFWRLPGDWRAQLGIRGDATGRKAFLARYRQVRYLFHLMLSLVDPSPEPKDRVLPEAGLALRRAKLSEQDVAARQARLAGVLAGLLEASVQVCSEGELAGFDGSVGLDATPPPSARLQSASTPTRIGIGDLVEPGPRWRTVGQPEEGRSLRPGKQAGW